MFVNRSKFTCLSQLHSIRKGQLNRLVQISCYFLSFGLYGLHAGRFHLFLFFYQGGDLAAPKPNVILKPPTSTGILRSFGTTFSCKSNESLKQGDNAFSIFYFT